LKSNPEKKSSKKPVIYLLHAGFLLGLLINFENGSIIFLRKDG
jgi:hypothetical protein